MFDPEKTLLVGVGLHPSSGSNLKESMDELKRLAYTAGAEVVGEITQKRDRPDQKYFIGPGKIEEIKALAASSGATLVIFNVPLSPAQERNLEEALGTRVIGRTELILDIFAQHAKTREGRLQVELAQSAFLLTRLSGHGVMMSRLGGGIGTRGPGESRLEYDRRFVRKRIADLKNDLEKVRQERHLRREKRKKSHLPLVSLVGYTNAGKSTLLNALTGAGVLAEDKLFATLDTTTRRLRLPSEQTILMTDTVGFITDLPHHLIAAFRATLEEVTEADLLVHVVDLSSHYFEDQMAAVFTVLEELDCAAKPMITVFNKLDRAETPPGDQLLKKYAPAVTVSALCGQGLEDLKAEIIRFFALPPERLI